MQSIETTGHVSANAVHGAVSAPSRCLAPLNQKTNIETPGGANYPEDLFASLIIPAYLQPNCARLPDPEKGALTTPAGFVGGPEPPSDPPCTSTTGNHAPQEAIPKSPLTKKPDSLPASPSTKIRKTREEIQKLLKKERSLLQTGKSGSRASSSPSPDNPKLDTSDSTFSNKDATTDSRTEIAVQETMHPQPPSPASVPLSLTSTDTSAATPAIRVPTGPRNKTTSFTSPTHPTTKRPPPIDTNQPHHSNSLSPQHKRLRSASPLTPSSRRSTPPSSSQPHASPSLNALTKVNAKLRTDLQDLRRRLDNQTSQMRYFQKLSSQERDAREELQDTLRRVRDEMRTKESVVRELAREIVELEREVQRERERGRGGRGWSGKGSREGWNSRGGSIGRGKYKTIAGGGGGREIAAKDRERRRWEESMRRDTDGAKGSNEMNEGSGERRDICPRTEMEEGELLA